MFRLHNTNLQAEINAFRTSLNEQNVTKEITRQLTERQRFIIDLLTQNAIVTIPEMSRKMAVTERTIKRDLQQLKQLSILRRIGGRKEGHWEIKLEH